MRADMCFAVRNSVGKKVDQTLADLVWRIWALPVTDCAKNLAEQAARKRKTSGLIDWLSPPYTRMQVAKLERLRDLGSSTGWCRACMAVAARVASHEESI